MEQDSKKITVQVPREMIVGMMWAPLLPAFMLLMNLIDNPGLHGVRGGDLIRVGTVGFGVGISFSAFMLFSNSKKRQS